MGTLTSPLRLALLGCGQIGRVHAERVRADGRAEFVAVCDQDPQRAARLQSELCPQASVHRRLDEILERSDVQGVVVATPTAAHFEQAQACLDRGWPVLCEKPLCDTRERIANLVARVAAGGPLLTVAYQRRSWGAYRTLRREILSAQWGPVLGVMSHNSERWQQLQAPPRSWRDDPRQNPGGFIGDAGSHKIDAVFFVTGLAPRSVFAHTHLCGSQVEIMATAAARLEGDVPFTLNFFGQAHCFQEYLHITCAEADFVLRDREVYFARNNHLEKLPQVGADGNPVSGFLDCLLQGGDNLAPAACALPVFDFTQGLLRSAREGREVDVGTIR